MRRRTFITLFGGTAAWPLVARAQQPAMPVIGYLSSGSPSPFVHFTAAFRKGLEEGGYVDGKNVVIEYRWAENQTNRLNPLASELVGQREIGRASCRERVEMAVGAGAVVRERGRAGVRAGRE